MNQQEAALRYNSISCLADGFTTDWNLSICGYCQNQTCLWTNDSQQVARNNLCGCSTQRSKPLVRRERVDNVQWLRKPIEQSTLHHNVCFDHLRVRQPFKFSMAVRTAELPKQWKPDKSMDDKSTLMY